MTLYITNDPAHSNLNSFFIFLSYQKHWGHIVLVELNRGAKTGQDRPRQASVVLFPMKCPAHSIGTVEIFFVSSTLFCFSLYLLEFTTILSLLVTLYYNSQFSRQVVDYINIIFGVHQE